MPVHQGDIYWTTAAPADSTSGIVHPCVIVQDDVINHSRVGSVVVCALTTNLARAILPGNLILEAGEANLPKASVVEVSKVSAIAKTALGEYIGSLSPERVRQILAGMQFVQRIGSR